MTSKIVVFNDARNSMLVADSADATITSERPDGDNWPRRSPWGIGVPPMRTRLEATFDEPYHTVLNEAKESDKLEALGFGEDMGLYKKGTPIERHEIKKGDVLRVEYPISGDKCTRTYTAKQNGGIVIMPTETHYLLERPKPYVPSTPGSVIVQTSGGRCWTLDLNGTWRRGASIFKGDPDFEFFVAVDKDKYKDDDDEDDE